MSNRSNRPSKGQSPSQQASGRSVSQKSEGSSDRFDPTGDQAQACPPDQRPGIGDDEEE